MLLRILRQLLLLSYIFVTFCALYYTLARKQIPHVDWPIITHFYAMMAPFQNYTTENAELVAEGMVSDGTWHRIDLTQYFPHSRGEIAIRTRLSGFTDTQSRYRTMAKRLQELETVKGRQYSSVRLIWEKWPKSQYGFYAGHTQGKVIRNSITIYTP